MRIGIDISQIVYEGTGVSRYVKNMVRMLTETDIINEYVLFGSSLRKRHVFEEFYSRLPHERVILKTFPIPPTVLTFLWNDLHIVPIEWFIGFVDIFWSSDWTQPPLSSAYGVTTIHDVSFLRFPESFPSNIIDVQKKRLQRVMKTCKTIFCDSLATKQDVMKFYTIPEKRMVVIYPGVTS